MTVHEFPLERVVARSDDLLTTAAALMVVEGVSSLVVESDDGPAGEITETDIVCAVADGVDMLQTTVERYMRTVPVLA